LRKPRTDSGAPSLLPSIAVLPFVDLNRDEGNEVFSDGLTEELINALAQVDGLHVVARTSAFHFKGKTGDARAIGASLGVQVIVEGSVRRVDDRLRITARAINSADGCHLLARRFDRRLGDVFQVQEEIARSIAEAVHVKFKRTHTPQYSPDPDAFALYLEGRYYWNKRTRESILKAITCLERALDNDARIAPAWAGLADCYFMLPAISGASIAEALRKARIAAQNALDLDSTSADAHSSLGCISALYAYDWRDAEACFQRALAADPNHVNSHLFYAAVVLAPEGRLEEAGVQVRRACELDPLSPNATTALATHLVSVRQYHEAIATCRRSLEFDPALPWTYRWMGEACLMQGAYDEAANAFSKPDAPAFAAGMLGYCYARSGRVSEARGLLGDLIGMDNPMLACQIAILHLGLGDHDAAFDSLYRACSEHNLGIQWLKVEPIWDDLRPDPRFLTALRQMGLDN
jgi:serine/threonine-protein kinase